MSWITTLSENPEAILVWSIVIGGVIWMIALHVKDILEDKSSRKAEKEYYAKIKTATMSSDQFWIKGPRSWY